MNVDFGGDGSGARVIRTKDGQNPVRIVVNAAYRYHPSGQVAQIIFSYLVCDDQSNLTGGNDGDDRSTVNSDADAIASQILAGLRRRD